MSAQSRVWRSDKSQGKVFWRKFEDEVARMVKTLGGVGAVSVQQDVLVPGKLSGRMRQIDVLVTGLFAGRPTSVIFEAKCHAGIIQIGRVDELVGKAEDVAAQHAVLCAPSGFSAGAKARAQGTQSLPLQIGLAHLAAPTRANEASVSNRIKRVREGSLEHVLTKQEAPPVAYYMEHQKRSRIELGRLPRSDVRKAATDYAAFLLGDAPLFVTA